MNKGDFLHSRKWRTIQNYTYSFGASVVLIGALAKLEHWPMASEFLMVGMSMEALIFFISAFEPLMDNPDWKRVYPQLREGDELPKVTEVYDQLDEKYIKGGAAPGAFAGGGSGGGGGISIKDLPAEQVKKLNESFEKLAEAATGSKTFQEQLLLPIVLLKTCKMLHNRLAWWLNRIRKYRVKWRRMWLKLQILINLQHRILNHQVKRPLAASTKVLPILLLL